MAKTLKLAEIAAEIKMHLNRFEKDPAINFRSETSKTVKYFMSNAFDSGSRVGVTYISYQGPSFLSKKEALEYLEWLRAGNVGKHFQMQREKQAQ